MFRSCASSSFGCKTWFNSATTYNTDLYAWLHMKSSKTTSVEWAISYDFDFHFSKHLHSLTRLSFNFKIHRDVWIISLWSLFGLYCDNWQNSKLTWYPLKFMSALFGEVFSKNKFLLFQNRQDTFLLLLIYVGEFYSQCFKPKNILFKHLPYLRVGKYIFFFNSLNGFFLTS